MLEEMDDYMWVAIDVKRGVMAGGDEWITRLKYDLLGIGCSILDVFGIGLDLVTGEIDYYSRINAKAAVPESTAEVPVEKQERVETLVKYFFGELPAFKKNRQRRYMRYEGAVV